MSAAYSPETIDQIERLLAEGKTQLEVSRILGVGKTTVGNVEAGHRKRLTKRAATKRKQ